MNIDEPVVPEVEVAPDAAPPVVEPAPEAASTEAPWYDGVSKLAEDAFADGGADEKAYREMVSKLTPDDIRAMPPAAQAILRGSHLATRAEREAIAAEKARIEADRKAWATERDSGRAAMARDHAALMAIFDSPEIRALKDVKVPEKPDLATEAGRKAFLDASAKAAAAEAFAPVIERSQQVQQQAAYMALREQYPELKVPEYEQRVAAVLKEYRGKGSNIDTETAVLLVRAADDRAKLAAQRDSAARARAEGARAVGRSAAPAGSRPVTGPPADVVKNGKLGEWIRQNPEAAKQLTGR